MSLKTTFIQISVSLILVSQFACSSKPVVNETDHSKDSAAFNLLRNTLQNGTKIAPGNMITVKYSGDSKVSGDYRVDFDGIVQLPYKISLKAANLSITELGKKIEKAYQPLVRGNNTAKVEIKERTVWIEVRGMVENPGRYLVRLDMPLEEVVSTAGGFKAETSSFLRIERDANDSEATKTQATWFQVDDYFLQYNASPELLWRGGEKLYFQMTAPADANLRKGWNTITVIGEVKEPKEHPLLPNADLLTYVTRSGGPSSSADLSKVEIIRRDTGSHTTVDLVKNRMLNELKPGDVVLIRATDMTPSMTDKIMSYALSLSAITMTVISILLI